MPDAFKVLKMPTRRGSLEYDWALLGPDKLVWHVSTFEKPLTDRVEELNRAWELGYDRDLRRSEVEQDEVDQLRAYAKAIAEVRSWYPEDVFPPTGKSLDAKSAQFARVLCDEIERLADEKAEV